MTFSVNQVAALHGLTGCPVVDSGRGFYGWQLRRFPVSLRGDCRLKHGWRVPERVDMALAALGLSSCWAHKVRGVVQRTVSLRGPCLIAHRPSVRLSDAGLSGVYAVRPSGLMVSNLTGDRQAAVETRYLHTHLLCLPA